MLTTNVSAAEPEDVDQEGGEHVLRRRELEVVDEISRAFFTATHPVEVYRLALARLTPLVGARFSSVFLRDPADPALLELRCAQNWPQSAARFLRQMRVRESRGPTGRAVAENAVIEVADVFADPDLMDWWVPARELGFVSIISLPLCADRGSGRRDPADGEPSGAGPDEAVGALSFYFDSPHAFTDPERCVLALVANQLAATVAKAQLVEELRRANTALHTTNDQLQRRLDEFARAKRLKDELLANVSHEFRTPLTSILGYGYLLSSGELGALEEKQTDAVGKIESAGRVLLRLVTDLIDVAQLKLGEIRPNLRREDAVMLARRAAEEAAPTPPGVRFTLHAEEAGIILLTDGAKVLRILTNLLRNAYEFTSRGVVMLTVTRRCDDEREWVEWGVSDTGIGVAEDARDVIFDEFRQADGSSTRRHGGAGLGLAIARGFAAVLGGDVRLEGREGGGSTFTLRLPACLEPS